MKIALIGATGYVGGFVLEEALNRNHEVTAISRHPEKLPKRPKLNAVTLDITRTVELAKAVSGHDAVISAFNPGWKNPDIRALYVQGIKAIIRGVKESGVKRLLVVGGAGSLLVKPGLQLIDTPDFPAEFKEGALGAREALNLLGMEAGLDWTFLSPSISLQPGARTGRYRTGTDALLVDEKGESRISTQDLAKALLDEAEEPRFIRKRFTVGY